MGGLRYFHISDCPSKSDTRLLFRKMKRNQ
jgi:hypothetical protein